MLKAKKSSYGLKDAPLEWYLPGWYLRDRRGRALDANYEL